mmetsp:Transcript_21084/g.54806  ORF Transcript_21084/g.54806 Transcript_21084/m.54806 type:complete len:205 (-) Transcript_21084:1268-1882(-)
MGTYTPSERVNKELLRSLLPLIFTHYHFSVLTYPPLLVRRLQVREGRLGDLAAKRLTRALHFVCKLDCIAPNMVPPPSYADHTSSNSPAVHSHSNFDLLSIRRPHPLHCLYHVERHSHHRFGMAGQCIGQAPYHYICISDDVNFEQVMLRGELVKFGVYVIQHVHHQVGLHTAADFGEAHYVTDENGGLAKHIRYHIIGVVLHS